MPWPIANREMFFTGTGIIDSKRKACLFVMKSLDTPTVFFNYEIPPTKPGFVRMDMRKGYHFIEKLDDNRCRYTNIANSDPKLKLMPNWFFNFMAKKMCHKFLDLIQKKAKEVPKSIYGERMRERKDFYDKIGNLLEGKELE